MMNPFHPFQPDEFAIHTGRTSSAWGTSCGTEVTVTHIATGISSAQHTDRSMHKNRANAIKVVLACLEALKITPQEPEPDYVWWFLDVRKFIKEQHGIEPEEDDVKRAAEFLNQAEMYKAKLRQGK